MSSFYEVDGNMETNESDSSYYGSVEDEISIKEDVTSEASEEEYDDEVDVFCELLLEDFPSYEKISNFINSNESIKMCYDTTPLHLLVNARLSKDNKKQIAIDIINKLKATDEELLIKMLKTKDENDLTPYQLAYRYSNTVLEYLFTNDTELNKAIINNDKEKFNSLLSDETVNQMNIKNNTALHTVFIFKKKHGNSYSVDDINYYVSKLLEKGALVNVKNNENESPYQIAKFCDDCQHLLASLEYLPDLHKAVLDNDEQSVSKMMSDDVTLFMRDLDNNDNTALQIAVLNSNVKMVKLLIEMIGQNVSYINFENHNNKGTALYKAVKLYEEATNSQELFEIIKLLVNAKSKLTTRYGFKEINILVNIIAIQNIELVELFIENKADIELEGYLNNYQNYFVPLQVAFLFFNLEIILLLVKKGAKIIKPGTNTQHIDRYRPYNIMVDEDESDFVVGSILTSGNSMQVHTAYDLINKVALEKFFEEQMIIRNIPMQDIGDIMSTLNYIISCLYNYIELLDNSSDMEEDDDQKRMEEDDDEQIEKKKKIRMTSEKADFKYRLDIIVNKIRQDVENTLKNGSRSKFTLSYPLFNKTFQFIDSLFSVEQKKEFIKMFVDDCVSAYNDSTMSHISCSDGVYDRFILTISNLVQGGIFFEGKDKNKLLVIFGLITTENKDYIDNLFDRWRDYFINEKYYIWLEIVFLNKLNRSSNEEENKEYFNQIYEKVCNENANQMLDVLLENDGNGNKIIPRKSINRFKNLLRGYMFYQILEHAKSHMYDIYVSYIEKKILLLFSQQNILRTMFCGKTQTGGNRKRSKKNYKKNTKKNKKLKKKKNTKNNKKLHSRKNKN